MMELVKKFCEECGWELREEKTGKFNPYTGQPETRMICPNSPCKHFGHVWVPDGEEKRWRSFFSGHWIWYRRCARCGERDVVGHFRWPRGEP